MIAILDYRAGNQTSVLRALNHLHIPALVTQDRETLEKADGIIFPGVGQASQAMGVLKERGLDACLAEAVARRQPVLGICLGCQILLDHSEEGDVPTLGIVRGSCRKFPELWESEGVRAPVPHMGWNGAKPLRDDLLFRGIPDDAQFYFVHGYYVDPDRDWVLAQTEYAGFTFCSAYGRPGLWALQFHPEKSGRHGLAILKNFHAFCQEAAHAL